MVRRWASSWQAFAVVLVLWGNAASLVVGTALPAGWTDIALGVALLALSLGWARAHGLTRDELGLRTATLGSGAGAGLAFALIAVAGALLVLRYPPLVGRSISYAPVVAAGYGELALRSLLWMPLDTILPEEIAFRGALLGALRRRYAAITAAALSAAVFAAWHVVIVRATLAQTDLAPDPALAALGTAGAFAAVFGGGVAFALLRLLTRSLAAPVVAHWAFNGAVLLGLRAMAGL